jgi:hypothetical protein
MLGIVTEVLAYPAALARLDLARIAAELDTTFRAHGARTQAVPLDLTFASRRGTGAIASFVLESDRIARAVVSHVRVAPFFAGLALTVHPHPDRAAPLLVADLMVLPTGAVRAFVDTCGPSIAEPMFSARYRDPLATVLDTARGVRREPVPAWIAPLSGGAGGRIRARRGDGSPVVRTITRYVERYLDALDGAPEAKNADENLAAARTVRDVFRAHGPASRYLGRAFGPAFTARYMKLLWRDD